MTFLVDNPNRRYKQYAYPRRGGGYTAPQIVLHTYEAPHTRSLLAAATWLTTRSDPGSYHALAGARSTKDVLQLAPWSYETWHSVPSNNWSIGISAVAYASQWNTIPKAARENLVKSMAYAAANAAKWLQKQHGRKVQPRLLTRAQAMRKESGFVYHATMDPGRRTDPGKAFPWTMFINEFNRLMGTSTTNRKDWLDMTPDELNRHLSRHAENVHKAVVKDVTRLIGGDRLLDRAEKTNHAVGRMEVALRQVAGQVGAPVLDAAEFASHLADLIADDVRAAVADVGGEGLADAVLDELKNRLEN